jgi:glycosyltransferase involved in cell wall biosynthesis
MLVTSDLHLDPRVQKEARSAAEAGYDVTVVCRTYVGAPLPYRVVPIGVQRRSKRLAKYGERAWTNAQLVRVAAAQRPDIIHANDLDTLPAGYAASRLSGARLLYDSHEFWPEAGRDIGASKKYIGAMEGFLIRRCAAVVTVNSSIAGLLAERYGISRPTVVMNAPSYIDTQGCLPRDWVTRFGGRRIVLHQGRYTEGRGIPEAVLAAHHLPDDVVLVFRGFGPIEEQLRLLVKNEGLSEKVVFLPPVPMNDLVSYAMGADLGLILYVPVNLNNLYASPNKLFEYIMAGVPIVASDVPFIRKMLVENDVGELFVPGSPEDMARVIVKMLNNPARLQIMRENCLGAAQRLSWNSEVKNLFVEYDRLTAAQR